MDEHTPRDVDAVTSAAVTGYEYTLADLQNEIAAKVEWLRENNGRTLHPDWITTAVLADHPDVYGEDRAFYARCTRQTVREETRRALNKYKVVADQQADAQLVLPGFTRLQKYYLVDRDQTQVAVRVDDLTDAEIDAKVAELRGMAAGCLEHVDELLRYRDRRREVA